MTDEIRFLLGILVGMVGVLMGALVLLYDVYGNWSEDDG